MFSGLDLKSQENMQTLSMRRFSIEFINLETWTITMRKKSMTKKTKRRVAKSKLWT